MNDPLGALYGAAVAARNALYDRRVFSARRLARPVISIGSISAGGAGKTPLVIALGQLLAQRGIAYDVLSRGYGRHSSRTLLVDPAGDPAQFGDEPLLIAQATGAPVFVDADRHRAGMLAESRFPSQLHLLDDGFQHRRLARHADIVLLGPEDLRDRLLPLGRLREPHGSLRRADVLAIPHDLVAPELKRYERPLWRLRREVVLPPDAPQPAVVFCGIARPHNFQAALQSLGIQIAEFVSFRDHHEYSAADAVRLRAIAARTRAEGFITTAKDGVKLTPEIRRHLGRVAIAGLSVELEDAEGCVGALLAAVAARGGQA